MPLRNMFMVAGTVGAFVLPTDIGLDNLVNQSPLAGFKYAISGSTTKNFQCDLSPPLDPEGDGLPSAESVFGSQEALDIQVERHRAVVQVPSVSYDDNGDPGEDDRWLVFDDLHNVLRELYPTLHYKADREHVNTYGLVYTIQGSDSSLQPILLAAHQDVVPVPDESTWTHPPFEGHFDGEYLWGRGASDDKNSLTALTSAVEELLVAGWSPTRTLILAFGFDEECSGYRGAAKISEHLAERYGEDSIAVILDEGGLGMRHLDDDTLYALPAVMERSHVDIYIDLSVLGGHSSLPDKHTGIGIIAEIVEALESHQYEPQLLKDSPVHHQLQCEARYSPEARPKITKLVKKGDLEGLTRELAKERLTRNMIQSSQSVDWIRGGEKINAMPEHVTLGINHRVAPHDNIPKIQHKVLKDIRHIAHQYNLELQAYEGDDEYEQYLSESAPEELWQQQSPLGSKYEGTIVLTASEKTNVTPITPTSGKVWDVISGTIRHALAPEADLVVPVGTIMSGNTDMRHYIDLSSNIIRWVPHTTAGSVNIHTIDERISMREHMIAAKFYYDFIRNFDQADI